MRCEEVRDRLVEYLDGGGAPEGHRLAEHIAACVGCRHEYEALRDTLRIVKEVREEDPGPAFWRENRDAIRAGVAGEAGRFRLRGIGRIRKASRPGLPVILRPAVGFVIVAAVLSGMVMLRDSRTSRPGDPLDGISAGERAALGEAYLEGALLPGEGATGELVGLSAADLADLIRAMSVGEGDRRIAPSGEEWIGPGWGGVEEEIRGLDPEQLERLMESLTMPPARG